RIAENVLKEYPNLKRGYFAIGNIAPDGGVPNEDWTSFTPPKDISHFIISKDDFMVIKQDKFILNDIEFFTKYLKNINLSSLESSQSFLLGYFTHLLTDNLWNYYIMKPLKESYLKELRNDQNFIWRVKSDWYDLDKIYLTEQKDSLFWTDFLKAEYDQDFLDFLPKEGVQRQVKLIKNFYQISEEEYLRISKKEYAYLKKEDMDKFIQDSTRMILVIFEKVFNKNFSLIEKISFLDDIISWN
ncbi:MAG: hypothetical protein ACW98X_11240, partial [Promethearchaeota archaeon]